MSSNRNRGANYNTRDKSNNSFGSRNNTRRFSANNNTNPNSPNLKSSGSSTPTHTPSNPPTRNAWGVNSINASVTGISSLSPKTSNAPSTKSNGAGSKGGSNSGLGLGSTPADYDVEKHMLDRMAYLMAKSIGSFAKVTVSSGDRFRGIIVAISSDGEIGVALALAEKIATAPGNEPEEEKTTSDKLVFQSKDIVDIEIESPDLSNDTPASNSAGSAAGSKFKTDTAISGQEGTIRERKLQRWEDSGDANVALTLEESADASRSWDQFAENERKFGVQSTYDEHYYTTAINRDAPDFEERERRAAQLANEIENSSYGGNVHVAEERGIAVDDSGMDEEDKYSGVQRQPGKPSFTPARGSNKYTPPAFRAPTNQPNNKGIPYDPAILTSQVANQKKPAPVSSSAQPSKSHIHTPVSHNFGTSTPISALFSASSSSSPSASSEVVAAAPETASEPESKKPGTPGRTPLPPSIALPASRQGKLVVDKDKAAANSKKMNNVAKDLAGNFAQFVNTEQQKLQQKKRNLQLKEKSDSIEEFRKFSQDFKINTPVPLDLFPILGKRNSQSSASKNATTPPSNKPSAPATPVTATATTASVVTTPAPVEKKTTTLSEAIDDARATNKTPAVPSPLTSNKALEPSRSNSPSKPAPTAAQSSPSKTPAAMPASPAPKLNLNFKAPEFRPNPNAHSFKPSFSASPSHSHTNPSSNHSSPVSGGLRNSHHASRTQTPHQRHDNLFFGAKPPGAKPFNGKFNMFVRINKEHEEEVKEEGKDSPVVIERSFLTNPTWPVAENAEHSFAEVVPSTDIVNGRASNIPNLAGSGMVPVGGIIPMNGLGNLGGMGALGGAPFGYGRTPIVTAGQMPPNMGGPGMMPVMQDPRAMMGLSPISSQAGFVYSQYPVVSGPQYSGGPSPGPPFFGRPPFPLAAGMMGQPGFMGFQPQEFGHPGGPQHGSHGNHRQSPRVHQAAPVSHMNQYGRQNFYSPQPQSQYIRSPGPQHMGHHGGNRHRNGPNASGNSSAGNDS